MRDDVLSISTFDCGGRSARRAGSKRRVTAARGQRINVQRSTCAPQRTHNTDHNRHIAPLSTRQDTQIGFWHLRSHPTARAAVRSAIVSRSIGTEIVKPPPRKLSRRGRGPIQHACVRPRATRPCTEQLLVSSQDAPALSSPAPPPLRPAPPVPTLPYVIGVAKCARRRELGASDSSSDASRESSEGSSRATSVGRRVGGSRSVDVTE